MMPLGFSTPGGPARLRLLRARVDAAPRGRKSATADRIRAIFAGADKAVADAVRPPFDGNDAFVALAQAAESVEEVAPVESGSAVGLAGLARILRGENLPPPRRHRPRPAEPTLPAASPNEDWRHKFSDAELLAVLTPEPQRASAIARALGVSDSTTVADRSEALEGVTVLPRRRGRPTLVQLDPDQAIIRP